MKKKLLVVVLSIMLLFTMAPVANARFIYKCSGTNSHRHWEGLDKATYTTTMVRSYRGYLTYTMEKKVDPWEWWVEPYSAYRGSKTVKAWSWC